MPPTEGKTQYRCREIGWELFPVYFMRFSSEMSCCPRPCVARQKCPSYVLSGQDFFFFGFFFLDFFLDFFFEDLAFFFRSA